MVSVFMTSENKQAAMQFLSFILYNNISSNPHICTQKVLYESLLAFQQFQIFIGALTFLCKINVTVFKIQKPFPSPCVQEVARYLPPHEQFCMLNGSVIQAKHIQNSSTRSIYMWEQIQRNWFSEHSNISVTVPKSCRLKTSAKCFVPAVL